MKRECFAVFGGWGCRLLLSIALSKEPQRFVNRAISIDASSWDYVVSFSNILLEAAFELFLLLR